MSVEPVVATIRPGKEQVSSEPSHEYLSFKLGQEEYGIDILRVQEIRSYEEPTHMANAPDYFKGVINLRGVIVPIVDLRIRLNSGSRDYTPFTVVIVLNIDQKVVGVVVDAVQDVVSIRPSEIKDAPEYEGRLDGRFITGIANLGQRMIVLMDIRNVIGSTALGLR